MKLKYKSTTKKNWNNSLICGYLTNLFFIRGNLTNEFGDVAGYKINTQIVIVYVCITNEGSKMKLRKQCDF